MNDPKIGIRIPVWTAVLYIAGSLVILPWTIYLGQSLPAHHIFRHWDIAWVGLDAGLLLSLLITGIMVIRRSLWVVLTSVAAGSLLVVDAWFDVMGAHHGHELIQAIFAALLLELPLAGLSFRLAYSTLQKAYER